MVDVLRIEKTVCCKVESTGLTGTIQRRGRVGGSNDRRGENKEGMARWSECEKQEKLGREKRRDNEKAKTEGGEKNNDMGISRLVRQGAMTRTRKEQC